MDRPLGYNLWSEIVRLGDIFVKATFSRHLNVWLPL